MAIFVPRDRSAANGPLWPGKALSGNKQNLVGEFCVLAGEYSDLRCLINTLLATTMVAVSLFCGNYAAAIVSSENALKKPSTNAKCCSHD